MTSTTIYPSRGRAYELMSEISAIRDQWTTIRNTKTRETWEKDKLDKGKVDLTYDLRNIATVIAYLDMAEHALRCAHVNASMCKDIEDAD